MISLQGVSKKYDNGHLALDNVSMEIEAGEFVFLCGASGAGKSTLIRLLFREDVATDGKITVNERNLRKLKRRDLLKHRRSIGMVFQDYRLLPKKNVYDNVAYAMEVTECKSKDIKKRVPEILEVVGLSDKAQSFPSELSGGEQQRVAIARALVNRPAILIADEPTGNLDPQNAWELMDVLERINEKGTTIVMATHAKDIVDKMKKRVIMLSDGHIVSDEAEGGYHEITVI
ncbi:MAG: cell division ATP-binding protein FtsE [Firmicutes bacterium]|nr:cell division ATP-binding protein FtsE [Bacillota bacterium]